MSLTAPRLRATSILSTVPRPVPGLRYLTTGPATLGLIATMAITAGAVMGGGTFLDAVPGAWFFGMPGGPLGSLSGGGGSPSTASLVLVYGGLLLLLVAWLRLMQILADHPGQPVHHVVKTLSLWSLPILAGPPLFSSDLYSYAGQGELVTRHISPYLYGTGVLGATPFNTMAGPLWANTPSPYGPLILRLYGLLTGMTDHRILLTLVLLRLVAVASLAVAIVALAALARDHGRDPAQVVALGAASPLVLLSLVGGAHNDVVMLALLLLGLVVARRRSVALGIVICAAAAAVKLPALLAVGFIGWSWPGPRASWQRRLAHATAAGLLSAATVAAASVVTGLGLGWVLTTNAASKISTGVTPVATLAHLAAGSAQLVGLGWSYGGLLSVSRALGVLAAGTFTARQLLRSPRSGLLPALGTSLLVISLLLPTVWAWYLPWGLMVLAPVATGRTRLACVLTSVAGTLLGAASNKQIWLTLVHASVLEDAVVILGLSAALLVAYKILIPRLQEIDVRATSSARPTDARAHPRRPWEPLPAPARVRSPALPPGDPDTVRARVG